MTPIDGGGGGGSSIKQITVRERLAKIQKELKAPKNQMNTFGKYKYRSCEDILEAVKPLLGECTLTISDKIVNIGKRYYVKATAHLKNGTYSIETTAFAREPEIKKGMDEAQITGATSSYARKYALNGLFAINDTKDADSMDNSKVKGNPPPAGLSGDQAKYHKRQSAGIKPTSGKCPECGTTNKYHKPNCPGGSQ